MNRSIDKSLLRISTNKVRTDEFGLKRMGLKVPRVRAFVKKEYLYKEEGSRDFIRFWDKIWKTSPYFESMSAALYFYQHQSLKKYEFQKIKSWVNRCTCWEHSDDLSKIFAQVVEDNPEWIRPTLRTWNKSKNSWKRRQSVVSLIEYARKRKRVLPYKELISFISPLLADKDYYVQKGLGWTMREIYNVYPNEMIKFFKANLSAISPVAYSAATEKVDKKLKQKLNLARKNFHEKKRV